MQELLAPPNFGDFEQVGGPGAARSRPPVAPGQTAVSTHDGIVTAMRVANPRDIGAVIQRMKGHAAMNGLGYVYRIPFKDQKTGRTTTVEGPTVRLALDLAREYGNCTVTTRVEDLGERWVIYARFTDYETGFSLERPFQQRKEMDTGMKDAERALDQVFQIGASKAMRNVVINALGSLADQCVDFAKSGILQRIEGNATEARKWIVESFAALQMPIEQVERVIGRKARHWTAPDMARLYTEIGSIRDGFATAEDLYPEARDADESPPIVSKPPKNGTGATTEPAPTGTEPAPEPESSGDSAAPAPTTSNAAEPRAGRPRKRKAETKPEPQERPDPENDTGPDNSDPPSDAGELRDDAKEITTATDSDEQSAQDSDPPASASADEFDFLD